MFKIVDGRECFYQWDLDRQITVEDSSIAEVHFCNRTDDCSLVVEVTDGIANVPNIILQTNFDVRVFGYDGKATLHEKTFKVKARTKPSDYIYTETEIRDFDSLTERAVEAVELAEASADSIRDTADNLYEFVDSHRLELVDLGDGRVELRAVAKGDEDIGNIHNYYTKTETEVLIENALEGAIPNVPENVSAFINDAGYLTEHQDISHLATKEEVPTLVPLEDYVTESELNDALANLDIPGGTGETVESTIYEHHINITLRNNSSDKYENACHVVNTIVTNASSAPFTATTFKDFLVSSGYVVNPEDDIVTGYYPATGTYIDRAKIKGLNGISATEDGITGVIGVAYSPATKLNGGGTSFGQECIYLVYPDTDAESYSGLLTAPIYEFGITNHIGEQSFNDTVFPINVITAPGGEVDLGNYAKKEDLPNLEEFVKMTDIPDIATKQDIANFITSIPEEYITETELNEALANIKSGLPTNVLVWDAVPIDSDLLTQIHTGAINGDYILGRDYNLILNYNDGFSYTNSIKFIEFIKATDGTDGTPISLNLYWLNTVSYSEPVYIGARYELNDSWAQSYGTDIYKIPSYTEIDDLKSRVYELEQQSAPDLSEYVTETELNERGYAYAADIPDVSAYQTEAQVNALIDQALGVIENGSY